MRIIFIMLGLALSINASSLLAQEVSSEKELTQEVSSEKKGIFSLSLAPEYSIRNFSWINEADSILTWRDMNIGGYAITGQYTYPSGHTQRIILKYGEVNSGYSTDDDVKNGIYAISWGGVYVSNYIAEYDFLYKLNDRLLVISGFSFNYGDMNMLHNNSIRPYKIDNNTYGLVGQSYPKSNEVTQKYKFYTFGPRLGGEAQLYQSKKLQIDTEVTFGLSFYYALADWPYRTDYEHPVSFKNTGAVGQINSQATVTYNFNNHFALVSNIGHNYFHNILRVNDTTFLSESATAKNEGKNTIKSYLNSVEYSNLYTNLGIKIIF